MTTHHFSDPKVFRACNVSGQHRQRVGALFVTSADRLPVESIR
jgi:hypothetical protein